MSIENTNIIHMIGHYKDDLTELWRGYEIIKYMLKAKPFVEEDVIWLCETTMAAIDHKIERLNVTEDFWKTMKGNDHE